jgi:hypothetical protein
MTAMLACATSPLVIQRASRSSTLVLVLVTAAAMVALRALPYLLYEQLAFDSDQAIVGLMAKHLVEGRAFPLFFYGQTYMLGVEAWAAAPLFALAGAGITTLRVSILAWNLAFIWLLITTLRRDCGLNPWWALIPASIIALAPPSVATLLMEAQGGIVEPFVWVAVLWLLRRRPLWFGIVFAVAFRNREFSAYAIPALVAVEIAAGEFNLARLREWLVAAVTFVIGWQSVEALKPVADLLGPGTRGQLISGFAGSQLSNLIDRADFDRGALAERTMRLVPEILGWFSGAQQIDPALATGGRPWLAWLAAALMLGAVAWVAALLVRRRQEGVRAAGFALYLAGVGAMAIAAFVASKPVLAGYSRYALLGLLLPVGIAAAILALEPAPRRRGIVAIAVGAWALLAAVDHLRVTANYVRHPLPNQARDVADRLIADGVSTAQASYWRAYVVTFVSGERVRVASRDFVRVQEYQDEFDRQTTQVTVSDQPCPGGRAVDSLYICRP